MTDTAFKGYRSSVSV